jgi:hypothetical protein
MKSYSSSVAISKMRIITMTRLASVVLLTLFAVSALAHHSVPVHYDLNTEDTVDGVITRVVWRNPHSFMELDVTNEAGEVDHWHIEMGTKNTMVRRGISLEQLEVGDKVTVIGVMHRQTPQLMYFRACVFEDGRTFTLAPTGQEIKD